MRPRSPVCLLAAALALATGLTLFHLGALVTESSPSPVPAIPRADDALVGDFYDAVNEVVRRGQTADLDHLLAPTFIEHGGAADLPPTRAGLRQYLGALAATYPSLRLRERDAFASGDLVVAHVAIDGAGQGTFLGLPLDDAPPPWGTVDVFRVADGAITEHWGGNPLAPALHPIGQWPLDVPSVAFQTVALTRTALPAGTGLGLGSLLGPEAIFLETGRLAVAVAPASIPAQLWPATNAAAGATSSPHVSGTAAVLAPGDLLLLPQGGGATAHAAGADSATFLTVGLRRPAGPVPPDSGAARSAAVSSPATPGVAVADLAGILPAALPGGPSRLGLGRVTLPPGAALPVHSEGIAVVAVEAGELGLADSTGLVWSRRAADGAVTTATDGVRTAGDAVVVEPGAATELRNAGTGPLVLLVATISPAG